MRRFVTPVAVARICHEANRAYCLSLGDDTQGSWDDAPEWQRQSALHGVEFLLTNPVAGYWKRHDNWLKEKAAQGWVYGPNKDPATKTHPCMVPFQKLPLEQQVKDKLFHSIVRSFQGFVVRT